MGSTAAGATLPRHLLHNLIRLPGLRAHLQTLAAEFLELLERRCRLVVRLLA